MQILHEAEFGIADIGAVQICEHIASDNGGQDAAKDFARDGLQVLLFLDIDT
jgi:hypothetical protein